MRCRRPHRTTARAGPRRIDEAVMDGAQSPRELADHRQCGCYRSPWIVIQTQPQAERWADENLRRSGYQTYLPLFASMQRDRTIRTFKHLVLRPLFPTYMFTAVEGDEWFPIRRMPGVRQVLLSGYGKPHRLPVGALDAIRASDAQRLLPQPSEAPWRPG